MIKQLLLALCAASAVTAYGQITLVTSSAALTVTDTISWAGIAANPTSPFVIGTTGGSTATVSHSGTGNFTRYVQGSSWGGNFLDDEVLLGNPDAASGKLRIDLANLIDGAGFQIQSDYYGAFTAQIDAFDSVGNLLGSVSRVGNSTGDGDGSAIFLGFSRAFLDVDYFDVYLTAGVGGVPGDFSINNVLIGNAAPLGAVPEPSTYGLLGAAALLAGVALRRRFVRK
jgi:opacity protein-like surface antigen